MIDTGDLLAIAAMAMALAIGMACVAGMRIIM